MTKIVDFLIDYETLGGEDHNRQNSSVVELGAIAFVQDEELTVPNYQDLIANGFRVKFDLRSQKGKRDFNAATMEWWKKQSDEARKILIPDPELDVSVEEGHRQLIQWMTEQGMSNKSQLWCRGNSFDIPIVNNCIHAAGLGPGMLPRFWNHRDVRTAIESYLGRGICEAPLPKDSMPGFIHHNGLHDCAKDVIMLVYAKRYSFGLDDVPELEDAHPASVKNRG